MPRPYKSRAEVLAATETLGSVFKAGGGTRRFAKPIADVDTIWHHQLSCEIVVDEFGTVAVQRVPQALLFDDIETLASFVPSFVWFCDAEGKRLQRLQGLTLFAGRSTGFVDLQIELDVDEGSESASFWSSSSQHHTAGQAVVYTDVNNESMVELIVIEIRPLD